MIVCEKLPSSSVHPGQQVIWNNGNDHFFFFLEPTNLIRFSFLIAFYKGIMMNNCEKRKKSGFLSFFFTYSNFWNVPGGHLKEKMLPEGPKKGFELDEINFGLIVLKTDIKPLWTFPLGYFNKKKLQTLSVVYILVNLPFFVLGSTVCCLQSINFLTMTWICIMRT